MTKHAKISLLSPSFFVIFMPRFHGNGTLEFPEHFVKEHWGSLSKHACLEVPTGEKWMMKMKKRNDRAWLYKGWENFVQKFSIKYGYLLVFRYQEKSNFIVQIFDLSTGQIKYPNTSHHKEVDFVIKEEECDTEDREIDNQSKSLQEEKGLQSRNPHFSVIMKPAYVTNKSGSSYLHIPKYARSYFQNRGKDDIFLKGENGKVWSMKYYLGPPPSLPRIKSGWRRFSQENNLKDGDECTFETLSTTDMIFKVTISRKTDEQAEVVLPRGAKRKRHLSVKEKSKAIECSETFFAVMIHKTQVQRNPRLNIPRTHSRRYLLDQHGNDIFLHRVGGKTWRVKCNINGLDAKFIYGWKDFVVGNDLQVGDSCVFELFPDKPNHYKVGIFSGSGSAGTI